MSFLRVNIPDDYGWRFSSAFPMGLREKVLEIDFTYDNHTYNHAYSMEYCQ